MLGISLRILLAGTLLTLAQAACANQLSTAPSVPSTPTPQQSVPATITEKPSTGPATATTINPDQLKDDMDRLMSSFMQANQTGACSIAVVYPDGAAAKLQTLLFNYGTLTKDSSTPVNSSTEYELGSTTKLFTADLLGLAVLNGKMQLDDPVQKDLPSTVHVPTYNGQAITLSQLATHTSGLPKNPEGGQGTLRVSRVDGILTEGYYPEDDIFNFLDTYKLTRAPGSEYEYSNLAFSLLGIAEERVDNVSYDDLVTNGIATPLGMRNTHVVLSPEQARNMSQGYYASSDKKAVPYAQSGGYLGGGGLRSTIQDMATYLAANIEPDQTKLGTALRMTQQKQVDKGPASNVVMGLGWQIFSPGLKREQFTKDGSTAGFNSYIAFSRVNRTGFVMLCNSANVTLKLVPQIYKMLNEAETPVNSSE